jgi:hypothetical protein
MYKRDLPKWRELKMANFNVNNFITKPTNNPKKMEMADKRKLESKNVDYNIALFGFNKESQSFA